MSSLVDIYIGRQPIFDHSAEVWAYELLFRSGDGQNSAQILGGDHATAQVMLNLFGDMGLKNVVGDHKAFINFTEGLLLSENQPFFPHNQVVIEVLEDVKVSEEMIESLKKLRKSGYKIALDDYIFNPELAEFEACADYIKVDILDVGPKKLQEHVGRLKDQGIKLLAEKVETREQFEFCKKIGFDLFQGYFFAKPQILKGHSLPSNKLAIIQLLSHVYDPEIDMTVLSATISQDVALSQKLLKFVSAVDSRFQLSSIHDAVMRFGLKRLQSWASMLVLSKADDKPMELFKTSLIRAKFCELVGAQVGDHSKDSYFTVGLFSTLDALMDKSLQELLAELNFDDIIKQALLEQSGSLGTTLVAVKGIEQGRTDFELPQKICASELSKCYLEAMEFANKVDLG
ncbi:diguanylate phosphodiesterase [Hydrogenovibrio crunogenus]|uniref:Diguanylate phosphodiesterase n=1 Tax=Hydrogenovibrio crunogenus TaxID=39765 RepID=A0A4P7NX47_9GAMM|nr:EAL domain-containing protein [Hydrogenovibrio crunogenus]QBZ82088.1 diguanylate phosphodiesterase [Hydrogenovibrio crunogenus]RUM90837.1 MAG: diguanylate phosphodiesterase [Thiomicrospira sp.]